MTFQILSLSGGGYLGLYTASVLATLEEQSGRKIVDMFDLFAGTSIGGIIALGLAAGTSAAEIRDAFIENGDAIFGRQRPERNLGKLAKMMRGMVAPGYSAGPLKATIERVVGTETRMHQLRRPTIASAVNLTKGGPKIFKTGHHPRLVLDWRLKVVDVALATSAAPTYFPIHAIQDQLFADGGLFANSPDLVAMHEAEQFLEVHRAEIKVLSVGTTSTAFAMSNSLKREMGIIDWVRDERLTSVIIGSQQAITHDMMRHLLGMNYVRIDRAQADHQRAQLALDCASDFAKADLQAMASNSVAELAGNETLSAMLKHVAIDRPFINASL
ncbi:MAG: CBASS cGAMP-activated phospholipase [Hyphomonadaceae bacterium]|nr:patatin-like phospholipase family protein [Hyphomonadaceae bacterium]MCZ8195555.1 CBASS cGAMP-activated phospholipase [Aquidulcibacter sp.]